MSSMKQLVLFLVLATALTPIVAARSLFSTEATTDNFASHASSVPSITYGLLDNSTGPGDARFRKEIGLFYGLDTMVSANEFVLETLYQGHLPGHGKDYSQVNGVIESFSDTGIGGYPLEVASTVDNNIRINTDYLLHFDGDVKNEFSGIMYHESTHVWQNTGSGMAPAGLITGIADYVRLKAGLPSVNWGKRGSGSQWDQGYEVTAYFLEFLDATKEGSVAELNAMMGGYYYDYYFNLIFGKSVDDLWKEYKVLFTLPFPLLAPAPAPSV